MTLAKILSLKSPINKIFDDNSSDPSLSGKVKMTKICCKLVTQQSLFYNMASAKRNGAKLLLSLSEVGQHLFEASIKGAEAFYELKMKFEI